MKLTRPIVWIDVETTGVDPVADRIVEFGAKVMGADLLISPVLFTRRFNPGIPIPKEASDVHGITDEMVRDLDPFKAHARGIWNGLKGKDIGGYNLRMLDLPILDEEFRRCGLALDLTGVEVIDACAIFKKKDPRDLASAVKRYCGREHEGAHGAGEDASATADVFLGQLREYPDLAAMELSELANYSQISEYKYADLAGKLYFDTDGNVCYAFGKHKGKRVLDEPGYADWMLNKAQFPGSTCDALRLALGRVHETLPGYRDHRESIPPEWRG